MFRKWLGMMCVIGLMVVPSAKARPRMFHTYATCYNLWGTMADGSGVRPRSVASNAHSLGTRIRLVGRSFHGFRRFVVRDTGGALGDGHVDIWYGTPNGKYWSCLFWGKRRIAYKLGWSR